jgi:RNA polymerase sigma factor (sigma-70 family)
VNEITIHQEDLDRELDTLALDAESYDAGLRRLVESYDEKGAALELRDPELWRAPLPALDESRTRSVEEQFRVEVDRILLQDRDEEAQLARRIEFARMRYEAALERAGIDPEDIANQLPRASGNLQAGVAGGFPDEVLRRWDELHALRTELVERNLYLVLINVERYSHTRVSRMDLIQEGASVLFRAVDGFDWRRGLLFRTYAVHWLNQAFRSFLYNHGNTVRLPVYLQKAMKHVRDALERRGHLPLDVKEIAAETDLGESVVETALGAQRSTHSIDAAISASDEGGLSLGDTLSYEDEQGLYHSDMEDITVQDGVRMALDRLSPRERLVIERRFGLDEAGRERTLAEIAEELGVSLERVRQIQMRAISKMDTPGIRRAVDPHLL